MIPEPYVKREARRLGLDPSVIDLDHALGITLWALAQNEATERAWVFKGGTCLRKLHFEGYRFSEDLDFTVPGRLRADEVLRQVKGSEPHARRLGVEFIMDEVRLEVGDDEYGRESIEVRLPYRGSLRTPRTRNILLHLSADEVIEHDPVRKRLMHPYPDHEDVRCEVLGYSLEEVLAEKLRALAGQRRHAIARDLYDVWVVSRAEVDVDAAVRSMPRKAECKGLALEGCAGRLDGRKDEFAVSWRRSLAYLVADLPDAAFERAWETATNLVQRVESESAR